MSDVPYAMDKRNKHWQAEPSWRQMKAHALFAYYMGTNGVFMVMRQTKTRVYGYDVAWGAGRWECSKMEHIDIDHMHDHVRRGTADLTLKYDDAKARHRQELLEMRESVKARMRGMEKERGA